MIYDSPLIFKLSLYRLYIILRSSIKTRNFLFDKLSLKRIIIFFWKNETFFFNIVEGILAVSMYFGLLSFCYLPQIQRFLAKITIFSYYIFWKIYTFFDPWRILRNYSFPQNLCYFQNLIFKMYSIFRYLGLKVEFLPI